MTHKNHNNQANKINKTPLTKKFDEFARKDAKEKLRTAMLLKRQQRMLPSKKEILQQSELMKKIINHPKMTKQILELYKEALNDNANGHTPNPLEIFNDPDQYKAVYYELIKTILEEMKKQNLSVTHLTEILNNRPYAKYLSACIECPLNPFEKEKLNNEQNKIKEEINHETIENK